MTMSYFFYGFKFAHQDIDDDVLFDGRALRRVLVGHPLFTR